MNGQESLNNKQNETITEKNKVALEVEKLHQQVQQKTTVDAKEALQVQREIFKEAMKQNDFLSYDAYKQALKRHLAVSRQADLKEKLQNKQKPNIEQLEFIMKEKQLELSQSEENTIKQREFVTKRKELVENGD
ncbi:Trigger factor [Listeria monocytogenes]|nr:Trigger factor [Listeria monocytogenes]